MRNHWTVAAAAMTLAGATAMAQNDLSLGDKVPDLGEDVTWIQKGPISEFQEGEIYVLDFWATWCGPCVASIPHIDGIADKYEDEGVTVIGVAIWPSPNMTPTSQFVAEQGEDMSYPIAADVDGRTAKKFMDAAGRNGIPTIMIVNRDRRLAWMGHPMDGMDEALEEIMAGSYDIEAAVERERTRAQREAEAQQIIARAQEAQAKEDWDALLSAMDELIALDPQNWGHLALEKFNVMMMAMEQPEAAYAYAEKMIESDWSENPQTLNQFAWTIATDENIPERDMKIALKAAERANDLTDEKDASILDTLAAIHFEMGNVAKAVEIQERAVSAAASGNMKQQLETRLAKYKRKRLQ